MHISLDSALGRQKRLNSVGESVLQIAPDAAAAYSLRSLTGGDPDVVRVRRESDNTEKDFSGSQIESGEMARWVNEQPTLPLDLRELDTNTGERDGALIEAAAAYSLRKLKEDFTGDVVEVRRNVNGETEGFTASEVTDGTLESFVNASFDDELPLDQATGAAAAYSLRNLSSSYTGNVVEVRRSSDDAVQAFTASEIADGTLEDWVTASLSNGVFQNNGYETYSGASESGFSATNTTTAGFATSTIPSGVTGNKLKVSFDIVVVSGSPKIALRATTGTGTASNSLEMTTSGSYTVTLTATGSYSYVGFSEGDAPSDFTVSNFQIIGQDGHVSTWYDQSGSDNHAVQTDTAKQPKIVDGGSLVTGGIDFDGTQFLGANGIASSVTGTDQPYSTFAVSKTNTTATQYLLGMGRATTSTPIKSILYHSGGNFGVQQRDDANTLKQSLSISAYSTGTTYLTSATSSGTVIDFSKNGSLDLDDFDVDVGLLTIDKVNIGARANGDANPLNGSISELIIYNSDQSTKRRAIEENIANHYDISLAAFSRDGTVSTWYDQSGNTNDAIQTDPTKQPKIVNGGSLIDDNGIAGVDFDSSNLTTLVATGVSGLTGSLSMFSQSVRDASGYTVSLSNSTTGGKFFALQEGGATTTANPRNPTSITISASVTGSTRLGFAVTTGDTYTDVGALGGALVNTTSDYGDNFGSGDIDQVLIGALRTVSETGHFDGRIREIIIYNSDQTANRTAIEANIGETYGITGIPAANDTVNGFVQTWYDQSGSGNDVVQTTAANQPKIVIDGVRAVGGMRFDDNQFLDTADTFTYGSGTTLSTFLVNNSDGDESAYLFRFVSDYIVYNTGGGGRRVFAGTNANAGSVTGDEELWTTISELNTAGGTSNFYVDGTLASAADAPIGTRTVSNRVLNIGGSGATTHWNGTANEVIFYATDQSSNRPAIEANIINHYDI